MSDFYIESMPYEHFVRRANAGMRDHKKGVDQSFMQNLMDTEKRGKPVIRQLGSYEKQLTKVQSYLKKAALKLSKAKLDPLAKKRLVELSEEFNGAMTTQALMILIEEGNDLTRSLIEDSA